MASKYQHLDLDSLAPQNFGTGLTDEKLITISTRNLNKIMKDKGLTKNEKDEIKKKRRTLKNRGYADSSRKKFIKSEEKLDQKLKEADEVLANIRKKRPELDEALSKSRKEVQILLRELGVAHKHGFI